MPIDGDAIYKCPVYLSAVAASTSGSTPPPIYVARFDIVPSVLPSTLLSNLGVFHGAELPYVWNLASQLSASDMAASSALIKAYTNFFYGNAPDNTSIGFAWPPFVGTGGQRVVISSSIGTLESINTPDFVTKCQFWQSNALAYDVSPFSRAARTISLSAILATIAVLAAALPS